MKLFIFLVLLSLALASQDWKKDICLVGCKQIKKDWQRELCEIGCNQIKSDSDIFGKKFKKFIKKVGKKAVDYGKKYGKEYVNKKYGIPLSDSQLSSGDSLKATTTVNVRSGPCTSYKKIGMIYSGNKVTYQGSSQYGCGYTWYKVSGSFGTGWIAKNFLQEVYTPPTPQPSSGDVSYNSLMSIMPYASKSRVKEFLPYLNSAMKEASITSCLRRSAFIAQLAHESGSLRYMEEIASGSAYEGRKDLGNIYPGDGKRYKGRGPIQLTGRANYRACGKALRLDLEGNPTIAATKEVGFRIAGWYWTTRSLNNYADQGTQSSFDTITKKVNGGYNGKADRDQFYWKARKVLGC